MDICRQLASATRQLTWQTDSSNVFFHFFMTVWQDVIAEHPMLKAAER